jgi:hypothetical protein
MLRARRFVAAAVVVALAMCPLILDQCAESCEAHTAAAAPACHHDASTTPRLGGVPARCGHDHGGPSAAIKNAAPPSHGFVFLPAPAGPLLSATAASADGRSIGPSPPDSSPAAASRLLPLRI